MNAEHPSSPRLTELEIRLSYQDQLLETLNQVVIQLRGDLQEANTRIVRLEQQHQLGSLETPADAPPPHY